MLEFLRDRRNSKLVVALMGAIIVVFAFWGFDPSGGGGGGRVVIAEVNGDEIYTDEYRLLYRNQANEIRRRLGSQVSEERLQGKEFKMEVLHTIINKMLILEEADDKGITVTDDELRSSIVSMDVFHVDGVFNSKHYKDILSANGISVGEFERYRKEELLAMKMENSVRQSVTVTPDEVRDRFFRDNEKIALNYIEVPYDRFVKDVAFSETEARSLLNSSPARFMIPDQLQAYYAFADYSKFASSVNVSDDKIKQYYEMNSKVFSTPEERSASHILIGPANPDSRAKIDEVMARLLGGADFGELAKEYSTDRGTKDNGGSLGYFGRGAMVPTFEEAAFSLKVGEVSGIIETRFGYHIVKLDDIKPESLIPLEGAVYDNIKSKIAERDAKASVNEALKTFGMALRSINNESDFRAAAKKAGLVPKTTGLISRFDKDQELVSEQDLASRAFGLKEGEVSEPISTPLGAYIVKAIKVIPEHPPTYEEAKDKVDAEYRKDQATILAKDEAERLLSMAKGGMTINAVASQNGYEVKTTKLFAKKDREMPGTGIFIGADDKMFLLEESLPMYPDVISKNTTHYIFSLKTKVAAPATQFDAMYDQIEREMKAIKSEGAYKEWIESIKNKSKIVINEELL